MPFFGFLFGVIAIICLLVAIFALSPWLFFALLFLGVSIDFFRRYDLQNKKHFKNEVIAAKKILMNQFEDYFQGNGPKPGPPQTIAEIGAWVELSKLPDFQQKLSATSSMKQREKDEVQNENDERALMKKWGPK